MKLRLAFLLFLAPFAAQAAGFADQSIFLSKESVTEGDTVLVHVVISNPSTSPFAGSLTIADEASAIGTLPVTLSPGAADTFSSSWHPVAGTHKITATLSSQTGNIVATQQASFTIAAKPAPPVAFSKSSNANFPTVESSLPVQEKIADFAPGIASSATPVFNVIDQNRNLAADKLFQGVTWARQELAKARTKTSATTTQSAAGVTDSIIHTLWVILVTIVLYLCSVLRSVVTSIGLFYPIVAFFILYLLWRGYRAVRRPSY